MTYKHDKDFFNLSIVTSLQKYILVIFPHVIILFFLGVFFYINALNVVLLMIFIAIVFVSLIYFTRLHLTMSSKNSITKISRDGNNYWTASFVEKEEEKVFISGTTFVCNRFIVLNLITDLNRYHTVLVTLDNQNKDLFRQLKVLIKTQRQQS